MKVYDSRGILKTLKADYGNIATTAQAVANGDLIPITQVIGGINRTQNIAKSDLVTGSGSTSPLTTKGDLWGFSTVDARFPVGANGLPIVADSAQALGIKYGGLGVAGGGTGTTTAFTAGSVVFAGASGVYAQDNANLFWDDTNNRLGIGTASPSKQFHIAANSASDLTQLLQLNTDSSGSTYMLMGESSTGGNYALFGWAGSAHSVGGHVYDQPKMFQIFGGSASGSDVAIDAPATNGQVRIFAGGDALSNEIARFSTAGMRLQLGGTAAASDLLHVAATGNANALRVNDTTGYVGICRSPVTSPNYSATPLAVSSDALYYCFTATKTSSNTTNVFALYDGPDTGNSCQMWFGIDAGNVAGYGANGLLYLSKNGSGTARDFSFAQYDNKYINFITNNVERLKIFGGGNASYGGAADAGGSNKVQITSGDGTNHYGLYLTSSRTDTTVKRGGIRGCHYTTAEEDIVLCRYASGSTSNAFMVGDNTGDANGITDFYGAFAANNTTLGGTLVFQWNKEGVRIEPAGVSASCDASCIINMVSTTKGLGLPVMSTTQQNAISSPATGLVIYNSTTGGIGYYTGAAWKSVVGI